MPRTSRRSVRRSPYVVRLLRARWRFVLAAAVCGVLTLVLTNTDPWARFLTAWDVAVALYLALIITVMHGATATDIRAHSEAEDEGRVGILFLTVGAASVSLLAIVIEMAGAPGGDPAARGQRVLFALATILLSWALIHVSFAVHYAHVFYDESAGLQFPGGEDPDYADFVYFSFVIGMTSQVSDVQITSKTLRRTATVHGIVSFLFNLALLSLMINVAASFISAS
jgi:uncharacterized membrane protein